MKQGWNGNWVLYAFLYASYNTITLTSILIPMKEKVKSKKGIIIISVLCTIIIGILALIIFMIISRIGTNISKIELPTVYAVKSFGTLYKVLYGIIILCAIFTTAISSAYGFLNNISKTKKQYKRYNLLICFVSIFVCLFGFSNVIDYLYPFFGFLGFIQLFLIVIKNLY